MSSTRNSMSMIFYLKILLRKRVFQGSCKFILLSEDLEVFVLTQSGQMYFFFQSEVH